MRLRAEYTVGSNLKFLANLDMMHLMERALRRADIPYQLTEGFNPHIKLSMGTVLPVGVWGEQEYFDLELADMEPTAFKDRMNVVLPPDMQIKQCRIIPDNTASLMKVINAASYTFLVKPGLDLGTMIKELLNRKEIMVQSRGKNKNAQKDLRPGIYAMEFVQQGELDCLTVMVSINEPVNVRFDELLVVFAENGIKTEYLLDFFRQGNYIKEGSKFHLPLEKG